MALTIGSLNLCNFSSNTNRVFAKNYDVVAEVIVKSGADVLALQEIIDQQSIDNLIGKLRVSGGANREWRAFFDKKQTWRNNREGYAFLWDENCVTLAKDDDGNEVLPELMTRYTSIKRPPMVARFVTTRLGELRYELCVLNTHIIFSPDNYQSSHPEWYGGAAMRAYEYSKIVNDIYPRFSRRFCTYAIIAGDYNLKYTMLAAVNARPKLFKGQPTMMSVQRDKTTICTLDLRSDGQPDVRVDNSAGLGFFPLVYNGVLRLFGNDEAFAGAQPNSAMNQTPGNDGSYVNDYDHFSFEVGRVGDYIRNVQRIDAPELVYAGSSQMFHSYKESVSDHVPIVATLDLSASQSF